MRFIFPIVIVALTSGLGMVEVVREAFANPDMYADAGFDDPFDVADRAWAAPAQIERRRVLSDKVMKFLRTHEILTEEPVDAFQ